MGITYCRADVVKGKVPKVVKGILLREKDDDSMVPDPDDVI